MPNSLRRHTAAPGLMLELATTDASLHFGRTILTVSWPGRAERNLLAFGAAFDACTGGLLLGCGPAVCWFIPGEWPRWTAA